MDSIYNNLIGKSVVITGATSGIGFKAAEQFAQKGAFVIGIGRSDIKIQQAVEKIKSTNPNGKVVYLLADLAHQKQVRKVGGEIKSILEHFGMSCLDVLINNAGIYLEKKHLTDDGIEMTFAVNHLAAFLLTHKLLPQLECSAIARVLTLSSYSHRNTPINLKRIANPSPYVGLLAYKRSKLCNILFTNEFNRRCKGVVALAVDPGLVNTDIAAKGDRGISSWVWHRRRQSGTSTDVPVKTLLYLAGTTQFDVPQSIYYRDCKPINPSRFARRKDLASELWALSTHLTSQ